MSAVGIAAAFHFGGVGARYVDPEGGTLLSEELDRENLGRGTAYFADDLMDPRNPGHDAWVARQKEQLDCDALVDPDHPGHREAVQRISHVSDATHESILRRIKEELARH